MATIPDEDIDCPPPGQTDSVREQCGLRGLTHSLDPTGPGGASAGSTFSPHLSKHSLPPLP